MAPADNINIQKEKLPKGLSYALKTSVLEGQLAAAQISEIVDLRYAAGHRLFEAFYWLPNENVDHCRFYIRTGAVSSAERRDAASAMEFKVIPEFIIWAGKILKLPCNSPELQNEPHFAWTF